MLIEMVLNIAFTISIYVFAVLLMYPMFRAASLDFFNSKGLGKAIAIILAIAGVGYASYLMYITISFFITFSVFLISMFSGAEYVILSRVSRLNLVPLAVALILILISSIMQEPNPTIYLITGILYLIGVGEGAYKHLLPMFEDLYKREGFSRSYAEAITLNFMTLCFLAILIRWFNIQYLPALNIVESAPQTSDIGFIAGVLLGALFIVLSRKERS